MSTWTNRLVCTHWSMIIANQHRNCANWQTECNRIMWRVLSDPRKHTSQSPIHSTWDWIASAAMLTMQSVTLTHWHNKPQTYLTRLTLLHCIDELWPLFLGYYFCFAGSLGAGTAGWVACFDRNAHVGAFCSIFYLLVEAWGNWSRGKLLHCDRPSPINQAIHISHS